MFTAKDASTGNGGSKILQPGTRLCRIVDIQIEAPAYDANNRQIVLKLEGVDQGDAFDGLEIDKNRPELGKYRGQIANVKGDLYDIKDFEWQGDTISKEQQIYNWVNKLARTLGVLNKMNADNVSGETIEDYVEQAKKYLVNPDLWALYTICGKEYYTEGYDKPNYRLFLASKSILEKEDRAKYKNKEPFILASDDQRLDELESNPKFIKFDPNVHIIKAKAPDAPKEIPSFKPSIDPMSSNGVQTRKTDLDLPTA